MRLLIVGSGYVGLVSGACFAQLGYQVTCVDRDNEKIRNLIAGRMPIYEPGLTEMVRRNVAAGRLDFACGMPQLRDTYDAVFIAVGTPARPEDQRPDLTGVLAVAHEISSNAGKRIVVVTKSTVPPGTGDTIERIIRDARPDLELAVVSNPEFLREGEAISDFQTPDRIVVGTDSVFGREVMTRLYRPLTDVGAPLLFTGRRAAELVKYAANAFLASKISFINEIADLCEAIDADVEEVANGVGLDRRIGRAFLRAGPGYGGSCFPKDSSGLLSTGADHGVALQLVASTIAVNQGRKQAMARRVIGAMGNDVRGRRIAVLGLTFKPNTDDMRDAPSIDLVAALREAGALLRVYDPQGMAHARLLLPDVAYATSAYDCVVAADCIVLATEWQELRTLNADRLATMVSQRVIVDLRNALDVEAFTEAGFTVHGIGRAARQPRASVARNQPASQVPTQGQQLPASPQRPYGAPRHLRAASVAL